MTVADYVEKKSGECLKGGHSCTLCSKIFFIRKRDNRTRRPSETKAAEFLSSTKGQKIQILNTKRSEEG